jgi:Pili and flagellar-assembly chaperone, PapD N-terminal domain
MSINKSIFFFSLLLAFAFFNFSAKSEFLYEPIIIPINAPDGKGVTSVKISNPFDAPARIQLSLTEWEVTEGNGIKLKDKKTGEESILNYLKISPLQFTLTPKQEKVIRIASAIPNNYPDGEYKLFFNMLEIGADRKMINDEQSNQKLGLSINKQINAGTYLRKGREFTCDLKVPTVKISRQNIKDGEVEKTQIQYDITYQNTGNVHTRKDIGLRIYETGGKVLFEKKYINTLIAYPSDSVNPSMTVSKSFILPIDNPLNPNQKYEAEFGFTPSPDDLGSSSCADKSVSTTKVQF